MLDQQEDLDPYYCPHICTLYITHITRAQYVGTYSSLLNYNYNFHYLSTQKSRVIIRRKRPLRNQEYFFLFL